jgi:hypothetical protein
MQEKTETKWYGWVILVGIVALIIYEAWPQKPVHTETQAELQKLEPQSIKRRLTIIRPQWAASGKEGVDIISGSDEDGRRIVVTTDGESTCAVGQPEPVFDHAHPENPIPLREIPNTQPIVLSIYNDGSGGKIEQRLNDGSADATRSCGVFVSIDGKRQ